MKPFNVRDGIDDAIDELLRSGFVIIDGSEAFVAEVLSATPASVDPEPAITITHYHREWRFIFDRHRFGHAHDPELLHQIHVIDAIHAE